jgi:hypothetical protein
MRGAADLNARAEKCQEKLASLNVKKNYKFTDAQTPFWVLQQWRLAGRP